MFRLTVDSPNLDDFWVLLVKSTWKPYSIVSGLWPATGGLPTKVDIGALYYAYASTYDEKLQDGVTISSDLTSPPLARGHTYEFDGTRFEEKGKLPSSSPYEYGLYNGGRNDGLTCGLCQDVTINGVAAKPPVYVQSLPPSSTAYFQANDRFWLGVGQFGPGKPQPGLVLSTSILDPEDTFKELSLPSFPWALGEFAQIDFSATWPSWVASYLPSTTSFQTRPDVNGGPQASQARS